VIRRLKRAARCVAANLAVGGAVLLAMGAFSLLQAAEGFFIGDSIAAATAQTIGMRGSAHHSVSLRRNAIAPQWQRFFQNGMLAKIPNKIGTNIYALYSDYSSGRNGAYSFVIGALVRDGTIAPDGMVLKTVPGGRFAVLGSDKGPLPKVVPGAWRKAWKLEDQKKLQRRYETDFEIYDQRSQDPQNGRVDIYVGMK
jgi:predicted transcriptional regulator YdeE